MELPRSLKLGDKTYEFEKLNKYQKSIYAEIIKQLNNKDSLTTDVEKVKHIGVVEFLLGRLELYGTLTQIKNLYEHDELTPTT